MSTSAKTRAERRAAWKKIVGEDGVKHMENIAREHRARFDPRVGKPGTQPAAKFGAMVEVVNGEDGTDDRAPQRREPELQQAARQAEPLLLGDGRPQIAGLLEAPKIAGLLPATIPQRPKTYRYHATIEHDAFVKRMFKSWQEDLKSPSTDKSYARKGRRNDNAALWSHPSHTAGSDWKTK